MKIVSRETSLTDAVLPPPLTGKEVERGILNFDPTIYIRHFRLQYAARGKRNALFIFLTVLNIL